MDRNTIPREPGYVVHDGATFFSEADINVSLKETKITINTQRHGSVDQRPTARLVEMKFTPSQFNATSLSKLFKFGSLALGQSIISATDKPIDIHTVSGKRYRIPCGFVREEPASNWSVKKPILGEVTMWGILGINASSGSLASYLASSAVAYPGDTSWDLTQVLTPACSASWPQASGVTTFDSIDTPDGWVISPKATIVDDEVDGKGIVNCVLTDYEVTAKAEPMNISSADMLAALGWGSALGSSKSAIGRDLKINAAGAYARLYNATLDEDTMARFSNSNRLFGPLTWRAQRSFTSGAMNPLFLVTGTNPDA